MVEYATIIITALYYRLNDNINVIKRQSIFFFRFDLVRFGSISFK